jgi:2'-5' RNA ligase
VRLFVALDLPDEVRRSLSELIAKLKPRSRGAHWVQLASLHITLKFIGHVENTKLGPIHDALSGVHSSQPVDLTFCGMGFFPNGRRPRAVWCGVHASANLANLAADIDRALAHLGVDAETRPFTPHLTLARFKSDEGVADLVRAAEGMESTEFGSATETEFHLYESLLKPSGAQYNRLASFPIVSGSAAKVD